MTAPPILAVENDPLIAMDVAAMVEQCGGAVVGPAYNVSMAMALIDEAIPRRLRGAVLDINLGGDEFSWPIADRLETQGIPFVFVSAFRRMDLPAQFACRPLLSKPVFQPELKAALFNTGVIGPE